MDPLTPALQSHRLHPAASASSAAARVVAAQIISVAGDRLFLIAAIWWLSTVTPEVRQPRVLAAFLAASTLPIVLFGPVWGRFVDRWDRRSCMLAADAIRVMIAVALALLMHFHRLTPAILFALCVPLFALEPLFDCAVSASIARLAENSSQLDRLVALESSIPHTGVAFGALAGALTLSGPLELALWLNASSFLISMFLVIGLPVMPPRSNGGAEDGPGTFKVLQTYPRAGVLLALFALLNACVAPVFIYLPLLMKAVVAGGARELALLELAFAGGCLLVLAGLTCFPLQARLDRGQMFGLAGLSAVCLAALGVAQNLESMMMVLFFWGASAASLTYVVFGYFQRCIPDVSKGRFFGIASSLCALGFPAGFFCLGVLAPLFELEELIFGNVLASLAISAGFFGVESDSLEAGAERVCRTGSLR